MITEVALQKDYLEGEAIETIYLGGGTPSLLDRAEIDSLFNSLHKYFIIKDEAEVTLEANPDDLGGTKLQMLNETPINRLSLGIQSFDDRHLQFMNRAHSAAEALASIKDAADAGFQDLSIDLIYGIPAENHDIWLNDLKTALQLPVDHLSAYCLTMEPGTVFGNRVKRKKMTPASEEFAAEQLEILLEKTTESGFEQYEISNFCKAGRYSRHNSSYWQQKKYLGIGPSAHSFDGLSRQYNIANNQKYLEALTRGNIPYTKETLTSDQMVNEYLMTTLRTKWGSDLRQLRKKFSGWDQHFRPQVSQLLEAGHIVLEEEIIKLTKSGKLIADEITLQLFAEEK